MALILNLETASTNCSVSLFKDGAEISIREDRSPEYSHSELLHLYIEQVLEAAAVRLTDLNAIAVSKGPGSYTGLRIGVASAKGLCYALGIPLISVPTLLHMARNITIKEGVIIPMLDARRMEVYSAVYGPDYSKVRETQAQIINEDSFTDYLKDGTIHLLGSGAEKCKNVLHHPNVNYHADILPSARQMGPLSYQLYKDGKFEDLAYFEPFYLKDFLAGKPSQTN